MNQRDDVEVRPAAKVATGAGGRHVIAVVGIDHYLHWPRLSNAVSDATGAAALFRRLGFEEITAPLFDEQATGKAIQSLVTDDLMTLGPDDSLVLFYAGHGGTRKHRLGGDVIKAGYLIPVDAAISPDKVSTWVDLEGWLRAVSLLPARHILVVLDACHSGIALDPIIKWRDIGSWQDAPLAMLQARRSRRIITSALDDQVALDSGPVHGHSLFTGCLLEGLTGGIRGDRGAVTTGSELGLYVQRRVQTYPGARQTPDFGTFAFDDRGEMSIPLAIEGALGWPEESATAVSLPAWLELTNLDASPELASGIASRSGVASRTGSETGPLITGEPGGAPPAASADDADALASALADARARAAAAMEQAWAARKASRRELEDRTGGEVPAAPSELAARCEWHEPEGQPRPEPSEWQPAVSLVPAHEGQASKVRDVAVDSGEASASGIAGEIAGASSAPSPSPYTLATSPSNAPSMAPRSDPAEPSTELAPIPGPRRPRRSSANLPALAPPTEIPKPATLTSDVRRKIVLAVMGMGVTLTVALIAYVILGYALPQMDFPADARLRGAAPNPPDAAPGVTVGGPSDAQPQPAGPPVGDCPVGMVRVPAGTFRMGSPEGVGDADEHPQHEVTLSAYCIDRTEVTVKAYAACVAAKGCSAAPLTVHWNKYSAEDVKHYSRFCNREDRPDHPINCVDWNQAAAYCTWAGKRLPTEAEWEYAARGTDGRVYPWGKETPSATQLNACGRECVAMAKRELNRDWRKMYDASDGWETTAPVGSFADGASPFGALDMAGNVWEWTADWYGGYTAAATTNPRGPETGTKRVLRGGAWCGNAADFVRAAYRESNPASCRHFETGFRCARED